MKESKMNTKKQAQAADVNNAEAPAASGGAVDYGQYAQAPAQNTPSYNPPANGGNGGGAVAPSTPSGNTGNPDYNSGAGSNANSNVGLDEANDLDHASTLF